MEVSSQTEKELKELIRIRMNKEIDDEYIQLLAEIINSDSIFQGQIIVESADYKHLMSVDYQDFKIHYNLEFLKIQFAKHMKILSTVVNLLPIYHIFMVTGFHWVLYMK